MSAIVGMIDWRGGSAGPFVCKALAVMEDRGRDGWGFWDGGSVALGWRRTILHAEDAVDEQPVMGGAGRYRLIFDGRIDNREDLATALGLDATHAREWPDSRYVLAAYERWAEDTPRRLLGSFSFAVWDDIERTFVLAQDHLGTRPLVYHQGNGFFVFASAAKALFAHPGVNSEFDRDSVLRYLLSKRIQARHTFFLHVHKAPPGSYVTVSESATRAQRYWQLDETPELRLKSDGEYDEAFREIMTHAVRRCLRTIHPVGSHLSSGRDSTAVTAFAAMQLDERGQKLRAYTAVPAPDWKPNNTPRGQINDEGPLAALVVQRYPNIEHTLIQGPGIYDLRALDRYASAFEIPRGDIHNIGWYDQMHRTMREQGVRVVMTGMYGNLTISFRGSDYLGLLLRTGNWIGLMDEWRQACQHGMTIRSLARSTLSSFLTGKQMSVIRKLFGQQSLKQRPACFIPHRVIKDFDCNEDASEMPAFSGTYRLSRRQIMLRRSMRELAYIFGGALPAWDLELRDPTSDRDLVEFYYALPEIQFFSHGRDLALYRRAMHPFLPPEIINATKRGRQAAEWHWQAYRSLEELAQDVSGIARSGLLEQLIDCQNLKNFFMNWNRTLSAPDIIYDNALHAIAMGRFCRTFFPCG